MELVTKNSNWACHSTEQTYGIGVPPCTTGTIDAYESCRELLHREFILQHLPQSIEKISVACNRLEGNADLSCLPPKMVFLALGNNRFSGSIVLDSLPERIEYLRLGNNRFTGLIDLRHIPASLVHLNLSNNSFDALVPLDGYSLGLESLWLEGNAELYGVLQKSSFPHNLQVLSVMGTRVLVKE